MPSWLGSLWLVVRHMPSPTMAWRRPERVTCDICGLLPYLPACLPTMHAFPALGQTVAWRRHKLSFMTSFISFFLSCLPLPFGLVDRQVNLSFTNCSFLAFLLFARFAALLGLTSLSSHLQLLPFCLFSPAALSLFPTFSPLTSLSVEAGRAAVPVSCLPPAALYSIIGGRGKFSHGGNVA